MDAESLAMIAKSRKLRREGKGRGGEGRGGEGRGGEGRGGEGRGQVGGTWGDVKGMKDGENVGKKNIVIEPDPHSCTAEENRTTI